MIARAGFTYIDTFSIAIVCYDPPRFSIVFGVVKSKAATRRPQNFGCDSEIECVSNDYTNPNTNPKILAALTSPTPKTLTALTLTLTAL